MYNPISPTLARKWLASPRRIVRWRFPLPRLALALVFLLALALGVAGATEIAIQRQIDETVSGYLYPSVADVPARPVALVFGAGILPNNRPSDILMDRIQTAVDLYKDGKVQKILMTGDNRTLNYNEVAVMRRTAMKLGVPGADVVKDHAGFRTYDSCYRARDVFEVQSAVLVTQAYHLPRAVYLARRMGIDAVGVSADRRPYSRMSVYEFRERFARAWSWVEVNWTHPLPHFLGPKIPVMATRDTPPSTI